MQTLWKIQQDWGALLTIVRDIHDFMLAIFKHWADFEHRLHYTISTPCYRVPISMRRNVSLFQSFKINIHWDWIFFRYLIRDESVIEYIFLYLFCALNIHLAGAFLFVSDAGFFGINMYLVAGFQDLADNFAEIRSIK